MTGRYLIHTPVESTRNEKRFDKAWRKFAETCRSLHRDGLAYDVQWNLAGDHPHVLITASGTAKPRRHSAARHVILPPPVPAQRSRERAVEVEWFLPENLGRRNSSTSYWRARQTRYDELAAMAEDRLRAELEYWCELETLSRQREHFKPGRTANYPSECLVASLKTLDIQISEQLVFVSEQSQPVDLGLVLIG
jgi:hypothetical protein